MMLQRDDDYERRFSGLSRVQSPPERRVPRRVVLTEFEVNQVRKERLLREALGTGSREPAPGDGLVALAIIVAILMGFLLFLG